MDDAAKKTALRMIPYGLYVLTARGPDGDVSAATVNWVTQGSFSPPLVAVGVKGDSHSLAVIRAAGAFALNVLGKGQNDLAFAFFKPVQGDETQIGGHPAAPGAETGAPILAETPAHLECRVREVVDLGDHAIVVGEVVGVGLATPPEGRADDATLWLKDLGERVYYGG